MQIDFQETAAFQADLGRVTPDERAKIVRKINAAAGKANRDRHAFLQEVEAPQPRKLAAGLSSSLYVLRVSAQRRVIFALDDDPVFDRILITLLRVVDAADADRAYHEIATLLHRGLDNARENGSAAKSQAAR